MAPHSQVSNFGADELLRQMAAAGVDAALIHPPSWDPRSHEVAVEAARADPHKFAILGYLPPNEPDSRERINRWKNDPGVLGLRYALVRPEQRTWHADGTMDWLWPAAEKAGLPTALMASRFFPLLGQIAERHPGLRLIVDHLGYVGGAKDDAAFGKNHELCALAKYPNIALKSPRRRPVRQDIQRTHIPIETYTATCSGFSMRSGQIVSSGAPTSRGCRVPTVSASRCSPRNCRGFPGAISNASWVRPYAIGSAGTARRHRSELRRALRQDQGG